MKLDRPYKCDYCTKLKGDTNHWWMRFAKGVIDHAAGVTSGSDAFLLVPWNDASADVEGVEHICSESCASKALSKWMAR